MCTVTWRHAEEGFDVFFNRDELKTRKLALPPEVHERNGVRYLAPIDGNAGGTWIGVNEFGICLGLLNYYAATHLETGKSYISRGRLLISLLDVASHADVSLRLQQQRLDSYLPFILLAFACGRLVSSFTWNGKDWLYDELGAARMPVTTSSFASQQVEAHRRRCFQQLDLKQGDITVERLLAFHRSHIPSASAYSVCMHRDDANTVSLSHVKVAPADIELRYYPNSPCRHEAESITRLSRRL